MTYQKEDLIVNGVSCQGTRTITTIPVSAAGNAHEIKVVDERWYSDELGALVHHIGSSLWSKSYELTNIVQTDPDESLFQISADYVLRAHP